MKYLIANWKANKNLQEAELWVNLLDNQLLTDTKLQEKLNSDLVKIIIAPPHPFISDLLYVLTNFRKKYPYFKNVCLAAQDISQYDEGNYTGEDTAKSMQGLVDYTIIGHSERRKFSAETDAVLFKKSEMAQKYNIEQIFVVRNDNDAIPNFAKMIAFEPETSIGTGENQTLDEVINTKKKLNLPADKVFLYGGSVTHDNASIYLRSAVIGGFLIGKASLNLDEFIGIVKSV